MSIFLHRHNVILHKFNCLFRKFQNYNMQVRQHLQHNCTKFQVENTDCLSICASLSENVLIFASFTIGIIGSFRDIC